jgi:hypothetical protein
MPTAASTLSATMPSIAGIRAHDRGDIDMAVLLGTRHDRPARMRGCCRHPRPIAEVVHVSVARSTLGTRFEPPAPASGASFTRCCLYKLQMMQLHVRAFEVLGEPVRRRILELLADGS